MHLESKICKIFNCVKCEDSDLNSCTKCEPGYIVFDTAKYSKICTSCKDISHEVNV